MAKASQTRAGGSTIALNKKARHDYFIEERLEGGIELQGWEIKSLRAKKIQIGDSYVFVKGGEAWISNMSITPLQTVSTHIKPEPTRVRKLLLHRREIDHLLGAVERKGYTLITLALYWKRGRVKVEMGLAKGKKLHDKRVAIKERDWQREKERLLKKH